FPPPMMEADGFLPSLLDPEASALWQEAEHQEFAIGELAAALALWDRLLQADLPPAAAILASFNRAALLQKLGRTDEAAQAFIKLRDAPLAVRTEAGFPVRHLAVVRSVGLAPPEETAEALIKGGADVNAKAERGITPLSIQASQPAIAELIRAASGTNSVS